MKTKTIKAWGGFSPDLGHEGVKYTDAQELDTALYAVFRTRKQAREVYQCVKPVKIVVPAESEDEKHG